MSNLPEGTKTFDRRELENCCNCGKGMMHAGGIEFYEVELTRVIIDHGSIQKQVGMEMMVGNPTIAAIMGPTTQVGVRLPKVRKLLCSTCAYESSEGLGLIVMMSEE